MIGMKLNEAKGKFFDPKAVKDPAERAQLRMLSRFGAFVRRRAKSSIRKRKRTAEPGMPPSSHTGLLKDFIFFFVEKAQKNMVAGPILLNQGEGDAPRLLEHGGDAIRRRLTGRKQEYTAHYQGNPFMAPAFQEELPKAPELLRDSIR
jgi:hypothetical protein